jgi:hypothetical protein
MMNGYSFTKINGQFYTLHKLAVFYMTKAWPIGHVDHINGVRNDNRCSNLRVVNRSQNSLNRKVYATNTSGFKGVNWHPRLRKWRVRIQKEGKRVALGCFASLEDARVAYTRAEKEYYGEFARGAHKPCKT